MSAATHKVVLVIGVTGPVGLGRQICRTLAAQAAREAWSIRALVRAAARSDPAKSAWLAELEALGVQLVEGDLRDAASLRAACAGASTVITTATATLSFGPGDTIDAVDRQGYLDLIEAAVAGGVERFVYTSYSHGCQAAAASPLTDAKRAVEQRLIASGMRYTILRPSFFIEAWLGPALGFDVANASVVIFGDGDAKIQWISAANVADVAVAALSSPAADNAVVELGGPDALSPRQVVAMCEQLAQRPVAVNTVPVQALHDEHSAAASPLAKAFAALKLAYVAGDVIDPAPVVAAFPHIAWHTVHAYLSKTIEKQ